MPKSTLSENGALFLRGYLLKESFWRLFVPDFVREREAKILSVVSFPPSFFLFFFLRNRIDELRGFKNDQKNLKIKLQAKMNIIDQDVGKKLNEMDEIQSNIVHIVSNQN